MEGVEFNPENPSEYNDFVPEVEKRRINILFWTTAILLVGLGLYSLYKSYTNSTLTD
jgi:hypothetical protein